MTTLHIEHPISDYTTWKAAFDRAAPMREKGNVRSFEIQQPVDDPAYIIVRLELDDEAAARAFQGVLEMMWKNPESTPALRGTPRARIFEHRARS